MVIAFKSMMIYNTMNTIHPLKLQWIIIIIVIMYYKSHILPHYLLHYESRQRQLIIKLVYYTVSYINIYNIALIICNKVLCRS